MVFLLAKQFEEGEVNRGIIMVNNSNNQVTGLKEMLKISKAKNPELMSSLANVNFIGLQYEVLVMLNKILNEFKIVNKNDSKIECLLPDNLNDLIKNKLIKMNFFEIKNDVIGLTNPEDEEIVKNLLKKYKKPLKILIRSNESD